MPAPSLSELLQRTMRRAGVGAQTLSKLTGVPRTAIDNWRDGTVVRPRRWQPLARIAGVLSLSTTETDALLAAAGQPTIAELDAALTADHPDRAHLTAWAGTRDAPRHRLRAPTADFVGRAATLDRVTTALRAPGAVVGLHGMGGIGKTELAVVVADLLRSAFPDGQLLVGMRGVSARPLSPAAALGVVIHAFAPEEQLTDDVDALQRRYRAMLGERRVLIVADDAADAAQARPLLPPTGSALLVTSRQRFTVPGMTSVVLGELDEHEAVDLLRAVCERLTDTQARLIAGGCGRLPLALRVSAGLLRNDPALGVDECVAALGDRRRLDRLRDPDDAQSDVAASLELSHDRLDGHARVVFRRLGVLAADFDTALADAVTGVSDVEATLRLLLRRSLLGYDVRRARWRLHDLVRDLAAGHLAAAGEHDETMWRYAEAVTGVAESIHERYLAGGETAVAAVMALDVARPHLEAAHRWTAEHAGEERADRLLVAATLGIRTVWLRRYDRAREAWPQALDALAAARRLGDEHSEAQLLNIVGQLHMEDGSPESAIAAYTRQLVLVRRLADEAGEARALNNLAVGHAIGNRPRHALPVLERLVELEANSPSRAENGSSQCNLGVVRLALGEPAEALRQLAAALAVMRRDDDRFGISSALESMSVAHRRLGDAGQALALADESLTVAAGTGDHMLVTAALTAQSAAQLLAGAVEVAVDTAERAVAQARRLGARRAEAAALLALGHAHAVAGRAERAEAALTEALTSSTGPADDETDADCRWLLGTLLLPRDRARAVSLLRAAVEHWQRIGHADAAARAAELTELVAAVPTS